MPKLTADVLYEMLLEKKRKNPDYQFCGLDLTTIGNVESQYRQLISEGKIIEKNDILDSFEVIG